MRTCTNHLQPSLAAMCMRVYVTGDITAFCHTLWMAHAMPALHVQSAWAPHARLALVRWHISSIVPWRRCLTCITMLFRPAKVADQRVCLLSEHSALLFYPNRTPASSVRPAARSDARRTGRSCARGGRPRSVAAHVSRFAAHVSRFAFPQPTYRLETMPEMNTSAARSRRWCGMVEWCHLVD